MVPVICAGRHLLPQSSKQHFKEALHSQSLLHSLIVCEQIEFLRFRGHSPVLLFVGTIAVSGYFSLFRYAGE